MEGFQGFRSRGSGFGALFGDLAGTQRPRQCESGRGIPGHGHDDDPGQQLVSLQGPGRHLCRTRERTARRRYLSADRQPDALLRLPPFGHLQQDHRQHAYHQCIRGYGDQPDRPRNDVVPRLGSAIRRRRDSVLRLPHLQKRQGGQHRLLYDGEDLLPQCRILLQRDLFLQRALHDQRHIPLRGQQRRGTDDAFALAADMEHLGRMEHARGNMVPARAACAVAPFAEGFVFADGRPSVGDRTHWR